MRNYQKFQKLLEVRNRSHSQKPPTEFVKLCGFENEIGEVQRMAWRLFGVNQELPTLTETRAALKGFRLKKTGTREVGNPMNHFLDSGAFSLVNESKAWSKQTGKAIWKFYDTDYFWNYMYEYMEFVDQNYDCIDWYANVDAIGYPEITARNQEWFETNGFRPVPVFHPIGSDYKWLNQILAKPYDLIGIGGLVIGKNTNILKIHLNEFFNYVTDSDGIPVRHFHGFGVTTFEHMRTYPWYSVDSTSWTQAASFGTILVPKMINGKFDFTKTPLILGVAAEALSKGKCSRHYTQLSPMERQIVHEWLIQCGVPLGESDRFGYPIKWGVVNNYLERRVVNIMFYQEYANAIPEYPWPYQAKLSKKGFKF